MIALLLDLSNIIGGFVLAIALLQRIPRVGDDLARADDTVRPYAWIVIALVAGGYYLIVHLTSGPHVFHFEVVGIAVGIALLRDRLMRRPMARGGPSATAVEGGSLHLAIFGLIAVLVGIQGLFTPD